MAETRLTPADANIGTVLRNPATGDTAVLVEEYDTQFWRVTPLYGPVWVEMAAIEGWDVLHDGTPPAAE